MPVVVDLPIKVGRYAYMYQAIQRARLAEEDRATPGKTTGVLLEDGEPSHSNTILTAGKPQFDKT